MPVPLPLSLGVVLCPDVAEPELSFPRGAWLCAEAIPLETSNAVAANMAEYFLMSYFFSLRRYSPCQRRGDGKRSAFSVTRLTLRQPDQSSQRRSFAAWRKAA